jgi:hypothetical protein
MSSTTRDFSGASWRLKLARAEHHMKELELEVARYVGRHPYKATRLDEGHPEAQPRRVIRVVETGHWILEITEQPPAAISIALGDVLTNLRASLDHIVAHLASGREQNHFPLVVDSGEEGWKRFAKMTKGMPAEAIAFLETLQPYNFPPMSAEGTPQIHPIRELSRFVGSDKHDSLIDLKCSLRAYPVSRRQISSAAAKYTSAR